MRKEWNKERQTEGNKMMKRIRKDKVKEEGKYLEKTKQRGRSKKIGKEQTKKVKLLIYVSTATRK